jgi:hypothetical protein
VPVCSSILPTVTGIPILANAAWTTSSCTGIIAGD